MVLELVEEQCSFAQCAKDFMLVVLEPLAASGYLEGLMKDYLLECTASVTRVYQIQ